MPEFRYRARMPGGGLDQGRIMAATAEAVAEQLSGRGLIPISIESVSSSMTLLARMRQPIALRVKSEELLMFTRQMYSVTKAGVPLVTALTRIAESIKNPLLRKTIAGITEKVASGQGLASAMQEYPKVFTPLMINLVYVGENTGRLEEAFFHIGGYLELEDKTMKRIKTALRYPTIVFSGIVVAIIVVNVMVIPAFADMFASFNAELPPLTQFLIGLSNFMLAYWPGLVGTLVLVAGVLRAYVKTHAGRLIWHHLQLKIPHIGSILQRILLARFARSFSMVSKTGVPIITGIELVARALGNAYMTEKVLGMREAIEQGDSLTKAANNAQLFTPLVLQMMTIGEDTGSLDAMLEEVADFYEQEVDYDLKRLSDAIEPIVLVIVGAMVLLLALGIFMPMWDMVGLAQRGF